MKKLVSHAFLALVVLLPTLSLVAAKGSAQDTSAPQAARATGDVTQIQPGHMTIHTAKGDVQVNLPNDVKLLHVTPGAKDLKSAEPIAATAITPGDRAVVLGHLAGDQQTIDATRVVIMTKSDIASLHQAEIQEWQTRGIEGIVKSVDTDKNEITIAAPNHPPTPGNLTRPVILTTTPKTKILRYAPNSVQFADAQPSAIAELKEGDQLRALGTKSDDSSHYAAVEVVFGTFHNIGATVLSVDPAANTLTVKNLATNKQLVVHAGADCKMHQLPEFVAQMIARLTTGGAASAAGGGGQPHAAGGEQGGAPAGGNNGGPGGGMRRGGMSNLSQALERMPVITLNEIKRGEPIVIFSTEGTSPTEVTALYILTGVEPILAAQPKGKGEMNLGTWNLSLGGGGGGEGGP